VRGPLDLENLSVFQGFYGHGRRGLSDEALEIRNPPVFNSEERRMLVPFPVKVVTTKAPVNNVILMPAYITSLKQILSLLEPAIREDCLEILSLPVCEADSARDIAENDVEF